MMHLDVLHGEALDEWAAMVTAGEVKRGNGERDAAFRERCRHWLARVVGPPLADEDLRATLYDLPPAWDGSRAGSIHAARARFPEATSITLEGTHEPSFFVVIVEPHRLRDQVIDWMNTENPNRPTGVGFVARVEDVPDQGPLRQAIGAALAGMAETVRRAQEDDEE